MSAKNIDAVAVNCASCTRPTRRTLAAVIDQSTATPTPIPASAPAAARPRVVGPASNSSQRPASSSPRNRRVEVRRPQTAPTITSTASVRHAVNPATVSIWWGIPNKRLEPGVRSERLGQAGPRRRGGIGRHEAFHRRDDVHPEHRAPDRAGPRGRTRDALEDHERRVTGSDVSRHSARRPRRVRRRSAPGTVPRARARDSGVGSHRPRSSASAAVPRGPETWQRSRLPSISMSCTPGTPERSGGAEVKTASIVSDERWRSSPSVPISTSRPLRRMATRSHSASTSLRMCDDRNTVCPFVRAVSTQRRNSRSMSGSSPLVGSSSTSRSARGGERGDQADLLAVALRVRAHLLRRVEREALDRARRDRSRRRVPGPGRGDATSRRRSAPATGSSRRERTRGERARRSCRGARRGRRSRRGPRSGGGGRAGAGS